MMGYLLILLLHDNSPNKIITNDM